MRWFVDLLDTVSLGNLGTAGPSNAVYRSTFSWNPIGPHELTSWAKNLDVQKQTSTEIDVPLAPESQPVAETNPGGGMGDAFGSGQFLDFGSDNWSAEDFGL